jgi:DNA-directed RNA polymerase subunit F
MSKTIDERVVSMKFENSDFERNISKSSSTLENFKQRLQFKDATKSFNNLESESKKVTFSGLISGIVNVSNQFSALDILGTAALWSLAENAVQAGQKIVKALTIDPVISGFNEYELKMGSIQTMMASTGESLETVNAYLDELNKYSDQTIYSFSDMTNNIGKFTNAGVSLKDAVAAIKGVSNEAALSGANANEASRAMYNFAQALSAGYVKLIDWKSIENANMATVSFKEELLKTAVACGTVEEAGDGMYKVLATNGSGSSMDEAISSVKNFNDSLQYQWMTSEVLIQTLSKYADAETEIGKKAYSAAQDVKTFSMLIDTLTEAAQSGWATTWELIVGDFIEAKTFWTALSKPLGNIIELTAKARNILVANIMQTNWEKFTDKILDAGVSINDFSDAVILASGHSKKLKKLVSEVGSLSAVLKSNKQAQKWVDAETVKTAIDEMHDKYKNLAEDTENYSETQIESFKKQAAALSDLSDQMDKKGSIVYSWISNFGFDQSGRDYLTGTILNISTFIDQLSTIAKMGFIQAFVNGSTNSIVAEFFRLLYDGTSRLKLSDTAVQVLTTAVQAFVTLLRTFIHAGGSVFLTFFRSLASLITTTSTPLLSFIQHLSDLMFKLDEFIKKNQIIETVNLAVANTVTKAGEAVKKYALAFWELDRVQALVKRFETYKEKFHDAGIQMIAGLQKGISDGGKGLLDCVLEFCRKILDTVRKVLGIHSPSTEFFEIGVNCVKGWIRGWVSEATGLGITVVKTATLLIKKVKELFYTISSKDMIAGAFTVGIFFLMNKLLSIFTMFGPALEGVGNVLNSAAKALNSVPALLKAKALEATANAVFKLAQAIALLAGSLVLLAQVDPERLLMPIVALVAIFGGLIVLLKEVQKINATATGAKGLQVASLLSVAASLYLVTVAFGKLAKLPVESIWRTIGLYTALCISLIGLIAAIGALAKKGLVIDKLDTAKVFGSILALAAGLIMMSMAIKLLSSINIDSVGDVLKILGGIATALGSMFAICIMINKIPVAERQFAEFGRLMISFSASMILLAAAIKALNGVSWAEFWEAQGKMAITLIIFGLLSTIIKIGKDNNIVRAGSMFVGLGIAMAALAVAIKILAGIGGWDIVKAELALGGVVGMFMALVWIVGYATKLAGMEMQFIKVGIFIAAIAAAMTTLVGALYTLSLINEAGLTRARRTILAVGGLLTVMVLVASKSVNAMPIIIAATAAITTMALILIGISHLPVDDLNRSLLALGAIMVAFMAGVYGISKLASLAKGAWKGLVVIAAVIAFAALVFWALSALVKKSKAAELVANSLTKIMISLAVCMVAMAALSFVGPPAIAGLGWAAAALTAAAIVIAVVSGIASKWKGAAAGVAEGTKLLVAIADAIGSFFGTLISSFMSSGIDKVIEGLTEFAYAIEPFITAIASIKSDILSKIKTLVTAIKNIVDASNEFSKRNIVRLGDSLNEIASPLVEFVGKFKKIDAEPAQKAVQIITVLTSAGSEASRKSINNLVSICGRMPIIGANLASLITSINVKGINDSTVDRARSAVSIIEILANAADALPKTGGSWQAFAGTKDIAAFVNDVLPKIGTGLNSLYTSLGSDTLENIDVINDVAMCINTIISSFSNIKNTGGEWQNLFGEWDPTAFMESLSKFGKPLGEFYDSVKGLSINVEVIDNVCHAIKSLSSLVTDKTMHGLNIQAYGPTSLERISEILPPLGEALSKFMTAIAPFGAEVMDRAAAIFRSFAKFGEVEYNVENITKLSKALTDMASGIGGLDPETMAMFVQNMSDITNSLINFAESGVNAETFTSTLTTIGNNGIQAFKDAIGSSDSISSIVSAVNEMINNVVSQLKTEDNKTKWEKLGKYLVTGFCQGITKNTFKAEAKAAAMASAAYEAAREALDVNSPSKVFRTLGSSVVEGFTQGIDQHVKDVESSASTMANSVIDSFSASMHLVNSVLEAESDFQPTIKPIVDLSEARQSASILSSLFSGQNGVNSKANAISQAMNNRVNMEAEIANGINRVRDAVNAINSGDTMYTFTTNVDLDGREIARGTATYTQQELNKLQVRSNRKLGLV